MIIYIWYSHYGNSLIYYTLLILLLSQCNFQAFQRPKLQLQPNTNILVFNRFNLISIILWFMTYFEMLGCTEAEFFGVKILYGRLILGAKRVVQKPFANCTLPNASVTEHHQPGSLRVGHDILYLSVSRTRIISLSTRHYAINWKK